MSGHCSKHSEPMSSPFKTVLGKIRDKYQTYCTTYRTHTMATCHRGPGCPLDRDINLHIEDSETTGLDNDNESTSGLDAVVALGGPEAEDHPNDLMHSNQAKLMVLMQELNGLMLTSRGQRRTTSREFGPHRKRTTKSLNEPFREVIHQYTDTLCTT